MEFFLLLFVRLFCVISVPFDLSVLFLYGLSVSLVMMMMMMMMMMICVTRVLWSSLYTCFCVTSVPLELFVLFRQLRTVCVSSVL